MKFYLISACKYCVSLKQTERRFTTQKSLCWNDLKFMFKYHFSWNFPKIWKITKTSIKLNHLKIGIRKLLGHIYRNIYRRKCRIFVNFRFSCWNFENIFEGLNFKTKNICCVCIESRTMLKFSESLISKEPFIMKILIRWFCSFCVEVRVVFLYQKKYSLAYLDPFICTKRVLAWYCDHRFMLLFY